MTEVVYEFENFQNLNRRGPGVTFWDHGRLRRPPRKAMECLDTQKIAMVLRKVRDAVNADPAVLTAAESTALEMETAEDTPPTVDVVNELGSTALESTILH